MAAVSQRWAWGVGIWLVMWALVYHHALFSAVSVWWINDTFNHCFLILPGVIYALWQQRGGILRQQPGYSWIGLLGLLGVMFVYALGMAAHAELLQHLAIFSLLPATALWLWGWRVIGQIWAPLAFVLFSVPVGEELMPYFQSITADLSVTMLQWLDIPVYRDGLYINVPNGSFVVAEACSGVRFFVACIVLGCAYAYLGFVAPWRSALFILFSIVMPVIANGIRAFGIIYIGYSSNMEHAVGADHLVYGWFFFAVIVVIMVLVGHFFSDGHRVWANQVTTVEAGWQKRNPALLVSGAALPLLLGLAINLLVVFHKNQAFDLESAGLTAISEEQVNALPWTPRYLHADEYRIGASARFGVNLYQAIYSENDQESEMISSFQRLFDLDGWSLQGQSVEHVPDIGPVSIYHVVSVKGEQRLLAYWYVVAGRTGSHGVVTKLQQAVNTLLMHPSGGALVAISLEFRRNPEQARQQLNRALQELAVQLSRPVIGQ